MREENEVRQWCINRELIISNAEGDSNVGTAKEARRFRLAKQQFCPCIELFCIFLCRLSKLEATSAVFSTPYKVSILYALGIKTSNKGLSIISSGICVNDMLRYSISLFFLRFFPIFFFFCSSALKNTPVSQTNTSLKKPQQTWEWQREPRINRRLIFLSDNYVPWSMVKHCVEGSNLLIYPRCKLRFQFITWAIRIIYNVLPVY